MWAGLGAAWLENGGVWQSKGPEVSTARDVRPPHPRNVIRLEGTGAR